MRVPDEDSYSLLLFKKQGLGDTPSPLSPVRKQSTHNLS